MFRPSIINFRKKVEEEEFLGDTEVYRDPTTTLY